ncbi:putative indole-3-pyruvate monooxygenase YUCCA10 [Gossypium australe]|uniref:Putative indole-3-pyruvate monooxygenase YUCCA10 n=1 Tax=Gossypium australe TaxID=47621 RepID=A0A5B6WFH0_9ROSI|nr:putative indole-3-pyruvate monooxygenase YUCCA10 [Gossypium australe]
MARRYNLMPLFLPLAIKAQSEIGLREAMKVWMRKECPEKECPEKAFRITGKGEMEFTMLDFSGRGLQSISSDAQNIANDIYSNTTVALGFNN